MSTTGAFSTGVPALDRELDGGVPPGTLVVLLAEPASQSELFLSELVAQHATVYLTPERTPTTVSESLGTGAGASSDLEITSLARDAPVPDGNGYVDELSEESLLVVDPIGPLERCEAGQFRRFLSQLRAKLVQTDSVAVVHALKHDHTPPQRHRTEYMADLVLDLVTEVDGDSVESQLLVPKFRGGTALTDAVRVELTDHIAVDTSRDIA